MNEKNYPEPKKEEIVKIFKPSVMTFAIPVFILLLSIIYYFQVDGKITVKELFFANAFVLIVTFLNYLKYKIVLTKKRVFIYQGLDKRRSIAWDLARDLDRVEFKSGLIGTVLNFGNLYFVNREEKVFTLKQVDSLKKIISEIVLLREERLEKIKRGYVSEILQQQSKIEKI